MGEYTPTTGEMRASYMGFAAGLLSIEPEVAAASFDRWRAAHDAKVKAEALREAAETLPNLGYNAELSIQGGELVIDREMEAYAQGVAYSHHWFLSEADRIEGEATDE